MADRLHRLGWILIGVGVVCFLSLFFMAPGVVAAAAGVALLVAGAILRALPGRRQTPADKDHESA